MAPLPLFRSVLFGFGLLLAGCTTPAREPSNLDPVKQQIRTYYNSGGYLRSIGTIAQRASSRLEERAAKRAPGERIAIVLDLDETLLTNWPQLNASDFGYVASVWDAWVDSAKAPAIEPIREVYRTARRLGIEVFFITGRGESHRPATEKNLREIGCADYTGIFFKPDGKESNGAFKTATRRRLTAEGHVIVVNIGDQASDLAGGFAERTFKLPDPFYIIQ